MQDRLSDSVRIIWLDREAVRKKLDRAVAEMVAAHPEIERVVLFGSLARGDAVPGSDADLLLVLGESDRPFLERGPRYVPSRVGVGVDVFPYTRQEIERMLKEGNPLIERALAEGIELFDRGVRPLF